VNCGDTERLQYGRGAITERTYRNEIRTTETKGIGTKGHAPVMHKDLSLVSLVAKWSGTDKSISLEEFFNSIERSAAVGNWQDADKVRVALLKLADAARQFYNGSLELHSADTTWSKFKSKFRHRFRDVHTDQYHFMNLQTARQGRNETPQEFADRCRALSQKIVCKVDDPLAQAIHYHNAKRMLLASFTSDLVGEPGRQVKYANPSTMEQALRIALTVEQAQKQERFNETFMLNWKNWRRNPSERSRRSRCP
jgi:hypothetical protein